MNSLKIISEEPFRQYKADAQVQKDQTHAKECTNKTIQELLTRHTNYYVREVSILTFLSFTLFMTLPIKL